jgi:hypothetical protein
LKSFARNQLVRGFLFTLLLSAPAFAQYGGGGSAAPSYGSGKAIGVGVGVAAAGAGVLYLTLHHRGSLTGCVEASDNDAPLSLVDDKKHETFSLLPGSADLKPGERVELRGKRSKDGKGAQTFQVSKVVRNLGGCSTESLASLSHSR